MFRQEFGVATRAPRPLQRALIAFAGRVNEAAEINLKRYCWQFGSDDFASAVAELLRQARRVDLDRITCPALFLYSEGEGPELQRQLAIAQESMKQRGVPVTARSFSAADGADAHCQLNNLRLAYAVIFDWLREQFGA